MRDVAVGYVRVSTKVQVESGLGLDDQKEKIAKYCEMKGIELNKIFAENGVSASLAFARRSEGASLLKYIKINGGARNIFGQYSVKPFEKKIKIHIVILKLDRAFRNCADCLKTLEDWDKEDISLHIIDFGGSSIDTGTATGKLMLTIMAGMAEWERNVIRERTLSALAVKRRKMEKLGGRTPYGWDNDRSTGKLTINEKEQEVVNIIMDLRVNKKMTLWSICKFLDSHEIKPKLGRWWKPEVLRRIIMKKEATELL